MRVLGSFKLIGRIWSPLLLLMIIPVLEKFWFFIKRTRAHSRAQRDPNAPAAKDGPPINVWSWEFWKQAAAATEGETEELVENHPHEIPNPQTKQRRGLYCALLLGIGVFILIIFLEIMLAYGDVREINQLSGVSDTIEMVIGCGDMLMILYKLKEQRDTERAKVLFSSLDRANHKGFANHLPDGTITQ